MAEKSTFIKIDRNIMHWGWYKDGNTFRVFVHLLLTANIREGKFLGVTIKRGELATSQKSIAESLGISIQSVRTSLSHLKSTGEITVSQHSRFSVISIPKYDLYQSQLTGKQQRTNSQLTVSQHQSKNIKKDINIQERENPAVAGGVPLSVEEVSTFVQEEALAVDPNAFWNYYEAVGWTVGKKPVRDWKALCRTWDGKPNYAKHKAKQQEDLDEVTRRFLEQ